MNRLKTYTTHVEVLAADLNAIQDYAAGQRPALLGSPLTNAIPGTHGGATGLGTDGVIWTPAAGFQVPAGGLMILDGPAAGASYWTDRVFEVLYMELGGAAAQPGGASDWVDWGAAATPKPLVQGYLGGYGYADNAGTHVTTGNPPVAGAGAPNSYALSVDYASGATKLFLYIDPSSGLCLYNPTGATLWPYVRITATAKLGLH